VKKRPRVSQEDEDFGEMESLPSASAETVTSGRSRRTAAAKTNFAKFFENEDDEASEYEGDE
jgi:hypothetical protein